VNPEDAGPSDVDQAQSPGGGEKSGRDVNVDEEKETRDDRDRQMQNGLLGSIGLYPTLNPQAYLNTCA